VSTRERILDTALDLFNTHGAPSVSTNHIADEMDISPGNLYYHFRSKSDIINALFDRYEHSIDEILDAPSERVPDLEDLWLYLHVLFEIIWTYRFLYRDLNTLLASDRRIARHFRRIMGRKRDTARTICEGLRQDGVLEAEPDEVDSLARHLTMAITYWLSFELTLHGASRSDDQAMAEGVYHVMSLLIPYLTGEARTLFAALRQNYLES